MRWRVKKGNRCWCEKCRSCRYGRYCEICGQCLRLPPRSMKMRRCAGCGRLEGWTLSHYCCACGRKFPHKRKLVTMREICWNVAQLIQFKSNQHSETTYNQELENRVQGLRAAGATSDQIKKFRDLAAELPITGGQFNRYHGT